MSHKVTVESEMTDKDLVIQALAAAKLKYVDEGDTLRVSCGGGRADYTINLTTGVIQGDSDYHKASEMGLLRQHYAHMKFIKEAVESGTQVQQTFKDERGRIVMICRSI